MQPPLSRLVDSPGQKPIQNCLLKQSLRWVTRFNPRNTGVFLRLKLAPALTLFQNPILKPAFLCYRQRHCCPSAGGYTRIGVVLRGRLCVSTRRSGLSIQPCLLERVLLWSLTNSDWGVLVRLCQGKPGGRNGTESIPIEPDAVCTVVGNRSG